MPSSVVEQNSQSVDPLLNWHYASVIGTGYYTVSEERVAVLRLLFRLPGIGFDRVGLGYRWGSDGLRGVRLVGAFPF